MNICITSLWTEKRLYCLNNNNTHIVVNFLLVTVNIIIWLSCTKQKIHSECTENNACTCNVLLYIYNWTRSSTLLQNTNMGEIFTVLLFMVFSIIVIRVDSNPPRFPNIGYVGSTYNLFKGNPQSTKGLDPGFTLRNMFEFQYDTNHTTADGLYSLPDGVNGVLSSACSFSFSSDITQSSSSYKSSLEVSVSADFKGWGASFSANSDYKTVKEGSSYGESKIVTSEAKCEAYATSIVSGSLNPAIVKAIHNLPPNSTTLPYRQLYIDFFNHWGTHFAHGLMMGGRYGIRSSFTETKFISMSTSGLDIKSSAGYSGIVSINSNAATSAQQEQAKKFESYRKDVQLYQVGGKPPMDDQMSTYAWAQTVKANPLPLTYQLIPISQVMTPESFPDDKDILKKQSTMQSMVGYYCNNLDILEEERDLCHSNETSSPDFIRVHFINELNKIECIAEPLGMSFVMSHLESTNQYILGTMVNDTSGTKVPHIVVEDSPLLADAIRWNQMSCDENMCFYRPECDTSFKSISDIICCNPWSVDKCLATIPRIKPCIHEKCIEYCGLGQKMTAPELLIGAYGNSHFGHPNAPYTPAFFRFNPFNGPVPCLKYDCLEYAI